MEYLIDNDVASNSHGWQWTAGCGTYIRTYVSELAHLRGQDIHEPWKYSVGYLNNYVEQIVGHATERLESLARHAQL